MGKNYLSAVSGIGRSWIVCQWKTPHYISAMGIADIMAQS
jgi:hypothetical protein